jgi:uncharacterized protein YukE
MQIAKQTLPIRLFEDFEHMSFDGMNVEAVRSLAGRLDAEGKQLLSIGSHVDKILSELASNWAGRDFQEFQSWWQDQHKPKLSLLSDRVSGLARAAQINADQQEKVSDSSSSSGIMIPATPPKTTESQSEGLQAGTEVNESGVPGAGSGSLAGSNRSWQEINQAYSQNASLGGYGAGQDFEYQCTAWANFRWKELGYSGPLVGGHGGFMAENAGGSYSTEPLLGAMVSYKLGDFGHVMIVEEIASDGATARISEMNTGSDGSSAQNGNPEEYSASRTITRGNDGWYLGNRKLIVANLP